MLISGAHTEKGKKKEKQAEGASKATSRAVAASSNDVHTIVDGMVPVPGLDEGEEEEEEEEAVEFGEAGREGVRSFLCPLLPAPGSSLAACLPACLSSPLLTARLPTLSRVLEFLPSPSLPRHRRGDEDAADHRLVRGGLGWPHRWETEGVGGVLVGLGRTRMASSVGGRGMGRTLVQGIEMSPMKPALPHRVALLLHALCPVTADTPPRLCDI